MTKSSKGNKVSATFTSVTTERNRVISWESAARGFNKPGGVTPSSKSPITSRPIGFVSNIFKLFLASLAKLPYALFKLGYDIAKFVTRGLSTIRRLLFVAK